MTNTAAIRVILQIEDDEDILKISRIALELSSEVELHQAQTGRQALEMLPRTRPDVILLDVMMPDMDGPETLSRIRDCGYGDLPVIFLTARARAEDLTALRQLGAAGVILKPFDPITLLDQIHHTIAESELNTV